MLSERCELSKQLFVVARGRTALHEYLELRTCSTDLLMMDAARYARWQACLAYGLVPVTLRPKMPSTLCSANCRPAQPPGEMLCAFGDFVRGAVTSSYKLVDFGLRSGSNRSARCWISCVSDQFSSGDDGCAKDSALRARLRDLHDCPGRTRSKAAPGDGAASRRGQHGAGAALAARGARRESRTDTGLDDEASGPAHEGRHLCINQIVAASPRYRRDASSPAWRDSRLTG